MNPWLKGNGYWCPTCEGTGRGTGYDAIIYGNGMERRLYEPCPACKGLKRIAATAEMVIAGTVPETPQPAVHTCMSMLIEDVPAGRAALAEGGER